MSDDALFCAECGGKQETPLHTKEYAGENDFVSEKNTDEVFVEEVDQTENEYSFDEQMAEYSEETAFFDTSEHIDTSEYAFEEIQNNAQQTGKQFCPNCGHERTSLGDFCHECGYNFVTKEAPIMTNDTYVLDSQMPDAETEPLSPEAMKRANKTAIGIGIVVLLGAVGYFGYNYMTEAEVKKRDEYFAGKVDAYSYEPEETIEEMVKEEEATSDAMESTTSTESNAQANAESVASSATSESVASSERTASSAESAPAESTAVASTDESAPAQPAPVAETTTAESTPAQSAPAAETTTAEPAPAQPAPAAPTETAPPAPAQSINVADVQNLFDQNYGTLAGNHTMYFQELGEVDGEPLIAGGNGQIRSASIIKLFTLAAYLQDVSVGNTDPNAVYTLTEADKVGGTGVIGSNAAGTTYTFDELVKHMIIHSDNTAHNIIARQLGGLPNIQSIIKQLGFNNTTIQRMMLDTAALQSGKDNYVSAEDTGRLLNQIYHGQLISPEMSQKALTLLSEQTDRSMLGGALAGQAEMYNKTGQYADYGVLNDVGIFKKGDKAYILVVLSQNGKEAEQRAAISNFGKQVFDLVK